MPRMQPDGKVTLVNVGTVAKPQVMIVQPANPLAPTVKELQAATDITPYLQPTNEGIVGGPDWGTLMDAWGDNAEAVSRAMEALGKQLDLSPKAELMWRLNQQVQQIDPGPPVNWRGLDA